MVLYVVSLLVFGLIFVFIYIVILFLAGKVDEV